MDYGKYISKVCEGELFKAGNNEIENYVSNIIGGEEGEKESFCLLQFFRDSNKVHLYEVKNEECRGTLRWWVEEINLNLKHDFNEDINKCNGWFDNKNGIVEIDSQFKTPEQISINDKLKRWVSGLGLAESCKKIYIKGQYSNTLALKYAFQNEGKVVKEVPNGKPGKLDINFPELMAKAVNLYDEQMTLHQYRNLKTYIPIDDNTLNSPFFKNAEKICILTWRDILPVTTSTTDDIAIPIATSEYKFKLISIEGYKVDLFRNVFIRIKDHISGKTKIVHVFDPFKGYYNLQFDEPASEPTIDCLESKHDMYVIDTNVFILEPDILSKIDKNDKVIISAMVMNELDSLKVRMEKAYDREKARRAVTNINKYDGDNILWESADLKLLPPDFDKKSPDNMILSVALKKKNEGYNPILLTNDLTMVNKAEHFLNIRTMNLEDIKEIRN